MKGNNKFLQNLLVLEAIFVDNSFSFMSNLEELLDVFAIGLKYFISKSRFGSVKILVDA